MTGDEQIEPPRDADRPTQDETSAALASLSVRLKEQAASLRSDIRRVRKALTDIDAAMSVSLERLNNSRENNELLQTMLESQAMEAEAAQPDAAPPVDESEPAASPRLVVEHRAGDDRRTGLDRRRDPAEITGLLRWLEGSSLDRRSGEDRRSGQDRRSVKHAKPAVQRTRPTKTDKTRPAAMVISIAEFRAVRRSPTPKE